MPAIDIPVNNRIIKVAINILYFLFMVTSQDLSLCPTSI